MVQPNTGHNPRNSPSQQQNLLSLPATWARGRCWDTGLKKASEAAPAASQLENQHIRKQREKHHWQYEQERGHSDGGGIN